MTWSDVFRRFGADLRSATSMAASLDTGAADPFNINAALAARKAARPARQDAARRASETRKARA